VWAVKLEWVTGQGGGGAEKKEGRVKRVKEEGKEKASGATCRSIYFTRNQGPGKEDDRRKEEKKDKKSGSKGRRPPLCVNRGGQEGEASCDLR